MTTTLDTHTHDQPASPAGDAMALVGAAIFAADPARLSSFYGMLLGVRFERKVHEDGRDHRIARIGGTHFEIKATTTPDGERTMNTFLGVSPELNHGEVDADLGHFHEGGGLGEQWRQLPTEVTFQQGESCGTRHADREHLYGYQVGRGDGVGCVGLLPGSLSCRNADGQ